MTAWSAEARLREHALAAGDQIAVLDDGRPITWADLDRRVDAVARAVVVAGVTAGGLVAIDARSNANTIAAILGVLRSGAVAAPIPPGLGSRERATILGVLGPALIVDSGQTPRHGGAAAARGDVDVARLLIDDAIGEAPSSPAGTATGASTAGLIAEAPMGPTPPPFEPEAPAVVVLTSGTTARPKAIVLSGRAMAASADSWLAALPPASGWLLCLGLGHVAGLGIVWRGLAARVPIRLADPADPVALRAALEREPQVSHVSLVPTQLTRLLDRDPAAPPPASLRAVLLGGGPIPPALLARAVRAGWPVFATYGLSETASGATVLPPAEAIDHPGSAGRALPGVRIRIDGAGADGAGEILVVSAARFSGELGGPGAAPDEPVRTGDIGQLDDDGRLTVLDRRVDRIVRGGENVAPAEVEAILETHPAVAEAAVVGRPDDVWGQVPVAAVVLHPGAADPGDAALAAHAAAALSRFKVPIAFSRLDSLPRTASGKLRRDVVRALLAGERAGELARPDGASIGWRLTGDGPRAVLLFPGTLSTARQLDRLAAALGEPGDLTVHAIDRRGTGVGRLGPGATVAGLDVGVHVADVIAYLDARGLDRVAIVGISFGGVLAIELAARHPDRVAAVVAYEPPYGPLADPATQATFATLARATADAHARAGPAAAAETFLRAVAGDRAWDDLPARSRAFLADEGDGAAADAALVGARPELLAGLTTPVTILTGDDSEPFYAPIADALAARIPGAARVTLAGLGHPSPISQPAPVAIAIRAALERSAFITVPESAR